MAGRSASRRRDARPGAFPPPSASRSAARDAHGLEAPYRPGSRIVIAVVVAFSLIALLVACVMLSASAAAEIQRRLTAVGLLRSLGVSARTLVAAAAVEATAFTLPAATLGVLAGWLAVQGASNRASRLAERAGLTRPLARAAPGREHLRADAARRRQQPAGPHGGRRRRSPVEVLRGGDVGHNARKLPLPHVLPLLGVRLVLARPDPSRRDHRRRRLRSLGRARDPRDRDGAPEPEPAAAQRRQALPTPRLRAAVATATDQAVAGSSRGHVVLQRRGR